MDDKKFEQELLRTLSLMNFDRSKTLLEHEKVSNLLQEQIIEPTFMKSDRLGPQGDFQPLKYLKDPFQKNEVTPEQIYKGLKYQIDSAGTNDDDVIYYVKKITRKNYPKVLKLVMDNENQISIMDWIMTDYSSVSERNAEEGEPSFWSIGGWGASFNWWINDKTVTTISKILTQFNDLNTGEGDYDIAYNGEVDLMSDSLNGTASNEQLAGIAHVVLPIAALAATVLTGGWAGVLLGGFIELGDAAIYKFVDKDDYAAGLALIFALAGPLDEVLGPLVSRFGKSILLKLSKKQVLSAAEETTLRYVARNEARLTRLTHLGMARQLIKRYILRISDASKIVKFIFWLTKKGYLVSKFTSKFGLIIGGSFLTWDAIAAKLGICNSVQLSELKQSDYKILQLIGSSGAYIQPYTKGCKTDKGEKIFKEMEKTLLTTNQRIKTFLEDAIKVGSEFSTVYSKYKMYEVVLIQFVLNHFGFSYIKPDEEKIEKSVQKGVIWNKEKCLSVLFGTDIYALAQHPECNKYLNPVSPIGAEKQRQIDKLEKTKPVNADYKFDYGQNVGFNWGYYDSHTKSMVEEFQKKYLGKDSADGVAGKNTLAKMLSLVEGLGEKQIKNYTDIAWDAKEIEQLRKKAIEEIKKDMTEEEKETADITPQQVTKTITEQKNDIVKRLNEANNNLDFSEEDIKIISTETEKQ